MGGNPTEKAGDGHHRNGERISPRILIRATELEKLQFLSVWANGLVRGMTGFGNPALRENTIAASKNLHADHAGSWCRRCMRPIQHRVVAECLKIFYSRRVERGVMVRVQLNRGRFRLPGLRIVFVSHDIDSGGRAKPRRFGCKLRRPAAATCNLARDQRVRLLLEQGTNGNPRVEDLLYLCGNQSLSACPYPEMSPVSPELNQKCHVRARVTQRGIRSTVQTIP